MSDDKTIYSGQQQARLNIEDDSELSAWSKKFDATPEQLKEAVAAVGNLESDIEMHLKGSRSTANSDRVHDAMQGELD